MARTLQVVDACSEDRCSGCGEPQPEWPAGWTALDDGRHYCPACRKNVYLLRTKWGAHGEAVPEPSAVAATIVQVA